MFSRQGRSLELTDAGRLALEYADGIFTLDAELDQIPLLMPGEDSSMRRRLKEWLDMNRLRVTVAGEFDDAALMAAFGRERVGAFPVPTVLVEDYLANGNLVLLGHADRARIEYFALSVQRRLSHPGVVAVTSKARVSLDVPAEHAPLCSQRASRRRPT